MHGGRTDASTSTDDIKGRPLCLFYFSHPFGVLSPEPPAVSAAPPHLARAFFDNLHMPPPPAFRRSPDSDGDYGSSSASRPVYDLGDATVHRSPVHLLHNYTLDFAHRDSVSSSLFSSDMWFSSSASSRKYGAERRVIPYNKILPPLRLPTPRDISWDSSDDVWPQKCWSREKFSLPPIELPCSVSALSDAESAGAPAGRGSDSLHVVRCRRSLVNRHRRRARLSGVQRMVTCLMKRTVKGVRARRASPALRDALLLLRDAWPEPRPPPPRGAATDAGTTCNSESATSPPSRRAAAPRAAMWRGELPGRAAASPGLLRRRYSMPETIMRKYRLAQQRSETEEAGPASGTSAASTPPRGACGCCAGARPARRDRELMRKSALLRLWGRAGGSPCRVCCCCQPCGTRSLDGSRSELRHASGWTTPKRLRLDSSRDRVGDDVRADSELTYKSHVRNISSSVETATDALVGSSSESEGRARNVSTQYSEQISDTPTTEPPSEQPLATTTDSSALRLETDERSLTDSSDTFSTSMPTTKETSGIIVPKLSTQVSGSAHIDGRISERSVCAENDESNILPYDRPLTVETPSYEILEIVVSETLNVDPSPTLESEPDKLNAQTIRSPILKNKKKRNIDIDEYVSNILVESLNSLTDQLESMNASICADRKLSIVEKEIKVKLQNTGVNTIVHLSPTSNNQIIFGNEELYNSDDRRDNCNNLRDSHNEENIREEVPSLETNNNLTSAESTRYSNISTENAEKSTNETFVNVTHHDNVNKAVLQQIQKLFQDELHNMDPEMNHSNSIPEISHIEISNVDVFIDNNGTFATSDTIEMQTQRQSDTFEVISGVGAGNYYEEVQDADVVVPRFSAFPHTDSMEVNTSSSEDAEVLGSECTSLVDSLDDPNSPRSVLLRKSFSNNKRSELVRSAIDVLDLLPEDAQQGDSTSPKDKGESFFIRIKDDNCDCEKENIVVADHMPETIKQRLYRRHRKRELRMECARRSKVKQLKRELEKQQHKEISKSKKEIERECMAIINALIDDVIAKIAQDEYKCMRIKQRSSKLAATKSEENVSKKYWKKDTEYNNNREIRLTKSDASQSCSEDIGRENRKSERHIRGKLSLQAHPPLTPEDGPRRIYQKSEIRDGTKCIEILEILEYVNSSQSSTDTINSDENQNSHVKNKKSRIPVPVYEKPSQRIYKTNSSRRNSTTMISNERNGKTSHVLAGMLLDALSDEGETQDVHVRRASVPCEPRTRSNSLRFKRVFDIIPEERSSLSVESPDDAAYNRRASAPSLDSFRDDQDEKKGHISEPIKTPRLPKESRFREMRSAGTSPIPDAYRTPVQVTVAAMTSPIRKSASTSPIKIARVVETTRERSWVQSAASGAPPRRPPAPRRDEEGQQNERRKSVPTQYEAPPPRRPVRSVHSDLHSMPSIADRTKRNHKEVQKSDNVRAGRRRSEMTTVDASEDVIATSHVADHRKGQRCVPHVVKKVDRRDVFAVDGIEEGHGATSDDRDRRRERESFQYEVVRKGRGKRAARGASEERARDETSSSSESGGSLLCSLAPAWLNARRRRRRAAHASGEWAVTVAGSCPAALPNDVEMRLRFPERAPPARAPAAPRSPRAPREPRAPRDLRAASAHRSSVATSSRAVECSAECGRARRRAPLDDSGRLTLTVKREASDSSILASKSVKKSTEPLPDLETYRASRSKTRSSVKTRRGCSLHCWLPQDEPMPIRNNGLSVLGCAIVPELKPRAPSMSERDLTRDLRARRPSLLRT